jgi:hypothetical protein
MVQFEYSNQTSHSYPQAKSHHVLQICELQKERSHHVLQICELQKEQ